VTEAALLTIGGMAAVTYATRATGLWLGGRLKLGPRFDAVLVGLPGAILVSLISPAIVSAGTPGLVAALATVLTAIRFRGNIPVPMVVGVAVLWAIRMI
jgi:uncharacterized membrane protein